MEKKPTLNVVIPIYNEEKELEESVSTLFRYLSEHLKDFRWTITLVDNASSDASFTIARRLTHVYRDVKAIHLDQKGRGRAVKHAWLTYKTDYVAYMDVDLSSDLKHFPPLVRSLLRGYDISIGTRNARGSRVYGRTFLRTVTSKTYILLIKLFFFVHFSDAQCGFKAASRRVVEDLIPRIEDGAWFFDTEFLLLAEKSGFRIYEEPVTWIDNPGSTVRVLNTAQGDVAGLWRLWWSHPWTTRYAKN